MRLFVSDARVNYKLANQILQEDLITQKAQTIRKHMNPEILMTPPHNHHKKQFTKEDEDSKAYKRMTPS
jgi:hypothetical protein